MPIEIGHEGDHGFEQPLGLLSDCHRRIERFLHAMLVVSSEERGRPVGPAGRHALLQATAYFRTAAPQHTADEEESLFPKLRECSVGDDSGLAVTIDALERDHRRTESEHARVDALVGRWLALERDGLPEKEGRELVARLESLERIYSDHIRIEDEKLFPAARRMLAPHDLEELGRAMAERRGLPFRGPLARFLSDDHERLHALLAASLAGGDCVRAEPFARFRAGILRHISMEEKLLIPRATAARKGRRPDVVDLLHIDHSAIAALLVPPPTLDLIADLRSILDRHDRCEEEPGGLYDTCDRALGAQASLHLVAELVQHPPVRLKPYNSGGRVARHLRQSVDRSWDAWRKWDSRHSCGPAAEGKEGRPCDSRLGEAHYTGGREKDH